MASYQMSERILGCPPIQTDKSRRCCLCNILSPQALNLHYHYLMAMPNQLQRISTPYPQQQHQLPQQYLSPGFSGQQNYAYMQHFANNNSYNSCNCSTIVQHQAWYPAQQQNTQNLNYYYRQPQPQNGREQYFRQVEQEESLNKTLSQPPHKPQSQTCSIGSASICKSQIEKFPSHQSLNQTESVSSLKDKSQHNLIDCRCEHSSIEKHVKILIEDAQENESLKEIKQIAPIKQNSHNNTSNYKPVNQNLVIEESLSCGGSDFFKKIGLIKDSLTSDQIPSKQNMTDCKCKHSTQDLRFIQSIEESIHSSLVKLNSHNNTSNYKPVNENLVIEEPLSCGGSDFFKKIGLIKDPMNGDQILSKQNLTDCQCKHSIQDLKVIEPIKESIQNNLVKQNSHYDICNCHCKSVNKNSVVHQPDNRDYDFYRNIGLIKDSIKGKQSPSQAQLRLFNKSHHQFIYCRCDHNTGEKEVKFLQDLKTNQPNEESIHDSLVKKNSSYISCNCKPVNQNLVIEEHLSCRGSDFFKKIGLIKDPLNGDQILSKQNLTDCQCKDSNQDLRFIQSIEESIHSSLVKLNSNNNSCNCKPVNQNLVIEEPLSCRGSDFFKKIGLIKDPLNGDQIPSKQNLTVCQSKHNKHDIKLIEPIEESIENNLVKQNSFYGKSVSQNSVVDKTNYIDCDFYRKNGPIKDSIKGKQSPSQAQLRLFNKSHHQFIYCRCDHNTGEKEVKFLQDLKTNQPNEESIHDSLVKKNSSYNSCNCKPVNQNLVIEEPLSCRGSDFFKKIGLIKDSLNGDQIPSKQNLTVCQCKYSNQDLKVIEPIKESIQNNLVKQNSHYDICNCHCKSVNHNSVVDKTSDYDYRKNGPIKDSIKGKLNFSQADLRLLKNKSQHNFICCRCGQNNEGKEVKFVHQELKIKNQPTQKSKHNRTLQQNSHYGICNCKPFHQNLVVEECVACRGCDFYRKIGLIMEHPRYPRKKSNFFKRLFGGLNELNCEEAGHTLRTVVRNEEVKKG